MPEVKKGKYSFRLIYKKKSYENKILHNSLQQASGIFFFQQAFVFAYFV